MQGKSSTSSSTPKVTAGGNQTAQHASTNSGATSSLAPPVTQVAARRARNPISQTQRITLDPEFKETALKLQAVGLLKPGDYDKLLNNANDTIELKAWMDGLKALFEDTKRKEKNTIEPHYNPVQVEKDKEAFTKAKQLLFKTIQDYLKLVPVDNSISSGWSVGSPVTVHAAPVLAPVAVANVITKIPDDVTVTADYNGHGNFVPLGGGPGMTRGALLQYVQNNLDHFVRSDTQLSHQYTMFNVYLGEAVRDSFGRSSVWRITVRYYALDNRVEIDHFGPFGAATDAGIG